MAYQRRGSAATNPNRVTLDLDPITSDALTEAAKTWKTTRQRLAYELVQRGLGVSSSHQAAAPRLAEPEPDPVSITVQRGLEAARNFKPKGEA